MLVVVVVRSGCCCCCCICIFLSSSVDLDFYNTKQEPKRQDRWAAHKHIACGILSVQCIRYNFRKFWTRDDFSLSLLLRYSVRMQSLVHTRPFLVGSFDTFFRFGILNQPYKFRVDSFDLCFGAVLGSLSSKSLLLLFLVFFSFSRLVKKNRQI